jgi:hypothetical protein
VAGKPTPFLPGPPRHTLILAPAASRPAAAAAPAPNGH